MSRVGNKGRFNGDVDLAYATQAKRGDKGIAIRGHISIVRRISQREGEYVSIWA